MTRHFCFLQTKIADKFHISTADTSDPSAELHNSSAHQMVELLNFQDFPFALHEVCLICIMKSDTVFMFGGRKHMYAYYILHIYC